MDAKLRTQMEAQCEKPDLRGIDYDAILREVDTIISKREYAPRCDIERDHTAFKAHHSHLFDKCMQDDFERGQLQCAIGLLKQVQDGTMEKFDADVSFGRVLHDKYGK